jgi:ethanolamine utilization protein EutM
MEAALRTAEPLSKIVSHTIIAAPSEEAETAIRMTINK